MILAQLLQVFGFPRGSIFEAVFVIGKVCGRFEIRRNTIFPEVNKRVKVKTPLLKPSVKPKSLTYQGSGTFIFRLRSN